MKIPKKVKTTLESLEKKGFEAFIVGGCVRDILRGVEPADWDIATNAKPEEIQTIFPNSFYDNKFFTVKVLTKSKIKNLKEIEITTYRSEAQYKDKRHPSKIKPAKSIKKDLSRRDFTINALALGIKENKKQEIIDPFSGQKDLKTKIIKPVGEPKKRFSEDALRLLRAVRFAATLGKDWEIENKTKKAIEENGSLLEVISKERIRDEFIKIIMSPQASEGLVLLQKTNLLKYVIPELEEGVGVSQNRHHIYTIFQHAVLSLKYAAQKNYNLNVRLAALFHDIAKPQAKKGQGPNATFYNHDVLGAKIATTILKRLRFPKKTIEKVTTLVKNHMFFYDPEVVTESSVRRLLKRVGKENIKELLELRTCDRKGSGVPKARPYRLRYLEYMLAKVSKDPISVQMLKINGNDIIKLLKIKPSKKIGLLLNALLAEILENPKKNKKDYLQKRTKDLAKLENKALEELANKVREKKMEVDQEEKNKFWVK